MQTLRDVAVHAQENTKNNMDGQTLSFLIEQDNLNQDVDNTWLVKVSVIFISMELVSSPPILAYEKVSTF